jgi:hypothetical protein
MVPKTGKKVALTRFFATLTKKVETGLFSGILIEKSLYICDIVKIIR